MLLARYLSPKDFGTWGYVFSWITFLGAAIPLGLAPFIVRELPGKIINSDTTGINRLWAAANIIGVLSLIAWALLLWLMVKSGFIQSTYSNYLFWASFSMPFIAQSLIAEAFIRGFNYPLFGQINQLIFRPAFLLLAIIILLYFLPIEPSLWNLFVILNISVVAGCLLVNYIAHKLTKVRWTLSKPSSVSRTFKAMSWLSVNNVLVSAGALIPIAFLGFLSDSAQVGIYIVANQFTMLASIGLMVINRQQASEFSKEFALGNIDKMKILARNASRFSFAISGAVCIVISLFANNLVSTFFGADFSAATSVLMILILGQLINAFFGSAGVIAVALKLDRQILIFRIMSYAISLIVFILLIPKYGAIGAAIGQVIANATLNVLNFLIIRKTSSILSMPF